MKACGKTTIGTLLSEKLQLLFIDSDTEIEIIHKQEGDEAISFRQIFKKYGEKYFDTLDRRILKHVAKEYGNADLIFACSGRTPLQEGNQEILFGLGQIIFLNVEKSVLLKRILAQGKGHLEAIILVSVVRHLDMRQGTHDIVRCGQRNGLAYEQNETDTQ